MEHFYSEALPDHAKEQPFLVVHEVRYIRQPHQFHVALPHELIIDTKESYTFTQFGLMQRQHDSYMDAGAGVFYVSDDKTNWTEVGTFTMQKIHDTQNFTLETPTRGRYFKVQITQSNRDLNTSLAEIYAYGL